MTFLRVDLPQKKRALIYFFTAWIAFFSQAQVSDVEYTGNFSNEPLTQILEQISEVTDINFSYDSLWLSNFIIDADFQNEPLGEVLRELLKDKGLGFIEHQNRLYIIKTELVNNEIATLVNLNKINEDSSIAPLSGLNIQTFKISGRILDGNTNQGLPATYISVNRNEKSTISDSDGFFSFDLKPGVHQFDFNLLGYEDVRVEQFVSANLTSFNIEMFEKSVDLGEVVVLGKSLDDAVQDVSAGVEELKLTAIKKFPTFLGEVDVVRSITALPGVTTVGEGSSGFNVRGGNVDENLILLDGMPIYNSSHLFGFFSVFNPEMIEDFKFYRGVSPAKFGGRISSVLDVNTGIGDFQEKKFSGSIGAVSSKLRFSTPVFNEKTSVLVGVRYAYPTYLLQYFPDDQVSKSAASFADANLKIAHKLSESDNLTSSTYLSTDTFRFGVDTTFSWTNFSTSLSWEKQISPATNVEVQGIVSKYQNKTESDRLNEDFEYVTSIDQYSLNMDVVHFKENNDIIEAGIQSTIYRLNPGSISLRTSDGGINSNALEIDRGLESAIHFSINKQLSKKLEFQAGLRASVFTNFGDREVPVYENPELPDASEVLDTISYRGDFFGGKWGLEPRLNIRYLLNQKSSLKLGYGISRQNLHLISITSAIAPNDYWKFADPNIPQKVASQVSLGYNLSFGSFGLFIDSYYKSIDNLLDYREGANVFLNPQIETATVASPARAYGLETKLEKRGKLSGWISYTYSRSERKDEQGGNSKWLPTNYDRPHNFNVVSTISISKRTSISCNFSFASGIPITLPEAVYFFEDQLIVDFEERNSSRIPDYHRLDLSVVIEGNLKRKGFKSEWAFSVYNVYGRRNPYSIFFDRINQFDSPLLLPQGYQLSILGQAFPSISYKFKFE